MAELTAYGRLVKHNLIDHGKTQKWLQDAVAEKTGMYMDNSYMHKILSGQNHPKKIIAAINEILEIEDEM